MKCYIRKVQDLNLRAGISRFAGFRVRCITTLPTFHEYHSQTFLTKSQVYLPIKIKNQPILAIKSKKNTRIISPSY